MSRRIKGITIELGVDKTPIQRAIKEIESVSRNLNKELRDVNNLLRFSPDNTQLVTQKQKLLGDQIKATKEKLDQLRTAEEQVQQQFEKGEINEEQYRAYQREIIETESKLKHYQKQLKETGNQQIIFGQQMQEAGERIKKAGDKMQEVGKSLSMKVTAPIMAIGTVGVKAAMDFETGMAGVRKTTDLTAEELDKMGQSLRNMAKEIPVSVVELTNLAETAGQLGIEKEHLVDFTRTVADLSVATNILGQEGATDMARFANIMQMSQKDFDRMGSAIVELGNNTATTEKEILSMGMRLAAAGKQANMSEADVLGIAAGLSALGMEAQAGGTAFSRVINQIQLAVDTGSEDLEGFAKVAGMSASRFADAWGDDAAAALSTFIVGLSDTTKHGQTTNEMLDELGITEIRLSDALRRTSGANELFNKTLALSNEAWDENNALQKEAAIRYETTESKLKIAKNELNDAAIDLGQKLIPVVMKLVNFVTDLVTGFSNLSPKTQDTIVKMALFAAALGPVVSVTGKVVSGIGNITGGIGKMMEAAGKGTGVLGSLVDKLGGIGPTALVGALIAASAALGVHIAKMWEMDPAIKETIKAFQDAQKAVNEATTEVLAHNQQIDAYVKQMDELLAVEEKSEAQKQRLADVIETLNQLMPDLNLEYDKEADALNRTRQEIEGVIQATKDRLAQELYNKVIAERIEAEALAIGKLIDKQIELQQLEESRARIDGINHKLRMTGLNDEQVRYAQLSEETRKRIGVEMTLTAEQKRLVRELGTALKEEADNVKRMTGETTASWSTSTHAVDALDLAIKKTKKTVGELEDAQKAGTKQMELAEKAARELTSSYFGLSDTGKQAGKSLMDGLASGIKSGESMVATAARNAARVAENAIKTQMQIRSPSGVGRALGQNFAESLGLGISDDTDKAERSAKDLAQAIIDATQLPDLKRDNVIDGRAAFAGLSQAVSTTVQGGDIIIQSMSVRDDSDIRKIAQELHNLQQGQKRGRGVAQ